MSTPSRATWNLNAEKVTYRIPLLQITFQFSITILFPQTQEWLGPELFSQVVGCLNSLTGVRRDSISTKDILKLPIAFLKHLIQAVKDKTASTRFESLMLEKGVFYYHIEYSINEINDLQSKRIFSRFHFCKHIGELVAILFMSSATKLTIVLLPLFDSFSQRCLRSNF